MARDTKKIDKKGRFFVPTKIREKLGDELVVTNGLDTGYLGVYQKSYFYDVIVPQFDDVNSFDPVLRKIKRMIIGEREEVTIDSQGRINVSSELWERIGANPEDEIFLFDDTHKFDLCTKATYYAEDNDLGHLVVANGVSIKGL